jgi:Uma2 family endonuclease
MVIDGLTIEEYEALPAALAVNHELEDGKLIEVSGNTLRHNWVRDALLEILQAAARKSGAGKIVTEQEFDFDGNAHAPDLSLIAAADLKKQDPDKRVQRFVPKLAIELASETDRMEKLMKKASRYRACGTHEVWIFVRETRQAIHLTPSHQVILQEHEPFAPESVPGVSLSVGDVLDLH